MCVTAMVGIVTSVGPTIAHTVQSHSNLSTSASSLPRLLYRSVVYFSFYICPFVWLSSLYFLQPHTEQTQGVARTLHPSLFAFPSLGKIFPRMVGAPPPPPGLGRYLSRSRARMVVKSIRIHALFPHTYKHAQMHTHTHTYTQIELVQFN